MNRPNVPLFAAVAGIAALAALTPATAHATSVTFAYGSLATGATDLQVQNFMNAALGSNGSVAVTGAVGSNSYNADGHVTGPVTRGTTTSYTLANLDPAGHGTFIENDTAHSLNDIVMSFSGLTISSVSFDLEIFPDNSCTSLSGDHCGGHGNPNLPDLTLLANGSQVAQWSGLVPSSSGTSNGLHASSYTHSPASGSHSTEQAPQLLGSSGLWTLPATTNTLDFQDWPATIAINDLVITFNVDPPPSVPEPATIALLGSALLGSGLVRRRRLAA